jgi:hypothetical protein
MPVSIWPAPVYQSEQWLSLNVTKASLCGCMAEYLETQVLRQQGSQLVYSNRVYVALIAAYVYEYAALLTSLDEHNAVLPIKKFTWTYVKYSVKQIAM